MADLVVVVVSGFSTLISAELFCFEMPPTVSKCIFPTPTTTLVDGCFGDFKVVEIDEMLKFLNLMKSQNCSVLCFPSC